MKNNCIICGREYKVCKTCEENRNKYFGWRTICDTAECYQAYIAITGVRDNLMTNEKAKEILTSLNIQNYRPDVKKQVDKIYAKNVVSANDKSKENSKNKKADE